MTDKVTTAGALLVKSMLPTEEAKKNFDVHRVLDKGGIKELVQLLLKHGGDNAHESINQLAQLFFNQATDIGASTPLSDYENDSEERQALIQEFEHKVKTILASSASRKEKAQQLAETSNQIRGKIEKQNLEYLLQRGSTAAKMAKTGARGNPLQLGQGTATPLMAADVKGYPIPVVIKHSFAEGLSPAEHLAMSYGGRASTVMAQLSTSLPGALFKRLTPNLMHEVITISDCGTTNGIVFPINDRQALIGRYEAGTNRLVDESYYKDLTMSNRKEERVRSPMTCEAHEGLCQKCYGLAANGKLPTIGENVGVIASQSVSEVLTQAMLGTKHQGGVAGKKRNKYEEASNLLNNPADNFQDEAAVSTLNGKVDAVRKTDLGDHEIYVNGIRHFASRIQDPTVKVGDKVRAGDQLSTGTINPRKLVDLRGFGAGRRYLASKLRDVYGENLDPRHFELVAKNMMKYVEVQNPGSTGFLPGQKVSVDDFESSLKNDRVTVPLSQAKDQTLARGILGLTPGTRLDQNHIDDLASRGIDSVTITKSGATVKPLVPGLQTVKLLDKNWVSKLSFNRLRNTLQEAAATGAEADVHSTDPIASYIIGKEFGEGEKGKY